MTALQVTSLLMMPIAGLLIGAFMLYITRKDRADGHPHPGE
jgi:hypothetical protein